MDIPKIIKIAGIVYTVEEVKGMADNEGLLGRIVHETACMYLEKDMSQERKEQVFIHELLHGIFKEAGYEEHEEDLINRVAIVLHQVLKDNDFSSKQQFVMSGSVKCSKCGADWGAGEICNHIHGPLGAINMNNTDIVGISGKEFFDRVLNEPTNWDPSPLEGLIATDPTNWGKSIREIIDEGGYVKCPACNQTWKKLENACDCPTAPELVENPNIESEGTK